MSLTVGKIAKLLNELVPNKYAYSWDNVGLITGIRSNEVKKIMIAVDATSKVVNQAIEQGVDMIITHHPLIFEGVKRISDEDYVGKRLIKLIKADIAVYAMHTNLDACKLSDRVAELLELGGTPLEFVSQEDNIGHGRIAELNKETTLGEYAQFVKEKLLVDNVRVYGDLDKKINMVAISQGAGSSMIHWAIELGADVLITGDISHNKGIDAVEAGLSIIDAGHYETEKFSSELIYRLLLPYVQNQTEFVIADENAPYILL